MTLSPAYYNTIKNLIGYAENSKGNKITNVSTEQREERKLTSSKESCASGGILVIRQQTNNRHKFRS